MARADIGSGIGDDPSTTVGSCLGWYNPKAGIEFQRTGCPNRIFHHGSHGCARMGGDTADIAFAALSTPAGLKSVMQHLRDEMRGFEYEYEYDSDGFEG